MWSAYDAAKRAYFGDHSLGNTILGTPDSIRALTRDQMQAYFERRYVAPNITVVAAGQLDWRRLTDLVERQCGSWNAGPIGREGVRETPGSGVFQVITKPKVAQEHVFLISAGRVKIFGTCSSPSNSTRPTNGNSNSYGSIV